MAALPAHFRSETTITGILAPDLHTLNTVLGAAIEEQAVSSLNGMRTIWDPDGSYALFRFVRQPQTFPDVVLRKSESVDAPILGIELKGWYVLAKEGVPTFRYKATPNACTDADLLVVVPWALSQVISGRPMIFSPHIVSARFAALHRNHHWQYVRRVKGDPGIETPLGARPYIGRGKTHDAPVDDQGNNFGRIARSGLLTTFIQETKQHLLSGVAVQRWLQFFQDVAAPPEDSPSGDDD